MPKITIGPQGVLSRSVRPSPRTQYRRIDGARSDRESFRESSSKKFDFAHRLDAVARPGSRELRTVKISASYDAWRPPKRRKNNSVKIRFFGSRKSTFRHLWTIVIYGPSYKTLGRNIDRIEMNIESIESKKRKMPLLKEPGILSKRNPIPKNLGRLA